jgi:two-component system osmolarity sensor histidine kinase EnvZ
MVDLLNMFKQWLPKTLFGRALIIVIAPVILVQGITTYVFFDRHWSKVTQLLAEDIAGEVSACVELFTAGLEEGGGYARWQQYAATHFGFVVEVVPGQAFMMTPQHDPNWREAILRPVLAQHLTFPFSLHIDDRWIHIRVATVRGVIHLSAPTKQLFTRTTPIFVWWAVLTPLLFLCIAIIFLRNQIKPLRKLSEIVDAFGKGREVKDLDLRGAVEVRKVAHAFNVMKERIQRQMTQRTEMLAGVSHDLKTPLTRMELALAMLPQNATVADLQEDVREMSRMIDGYLAFARGETGESPRVIDVVALLKKLQDKLDKHRIHLIDVPDSLCIIARPDSLQRGIMNILNNALRYAQNGYVSLRSGISTVHIIIEDDGPGIPQAHYENVFRPFFRLENSRNQETGGIGLGLAITRTIIHNHGGHIHLEPSQRYGGLRVLLALPL